MEEFTEIQEVNAVAMANSFWINRGNPASSTDS